MLSAPVVLYPPLQTLEEDLGTAAVQFIQAADRAQDIGAYGMREETHTLKNQRIRLKLRRVGATTKERKRRLTFRWFNICDIG
jgi:hypothetical protein